MNEFNENGEQGVITGMLHNFPGTMPGSDTDFSLKEDPEEQSTGSIPVECDSTAELKTCRPAVEGDVIELGGEFDYEGSTGIEVLIATNGFSVGTPISIPPI